MIRKLPKDYSEEGQESSKRIKIAMESTCFTGIKSSSTSPFEINTNKPLLKLEETTFDQLPFEILGVILSFVDDKELIHSLKSILRSCLSLFAFMSEKEQIIGWLKRRKSLICSNVTHLKYLSRFTIDSFQLGRNQSQEDKARSQNPCQFRIENVDKLNDRCFSIIERFETVEIVGTAFEYRSLMSLLNPRAKIKHLLFTNCSYSDEENQRPQRNISPHLKTIGFSGKHSKLINVLTSLPLNNVEEMYIDRPSCEELALIGVQACNLKKLSIQGNSFHLNLQNMTQLQQLSIDSLYYLKESLEHQTVSLELNCDTIVIGSPHYEICDKLMSMLKNVKKVVVRRVTCTSSRNSLRETLTELSKFEEIIIPETFYNFNSENLTEISIPKSRKITVMVSHHNRPLVEVLRFRLEKLLPNCIICLQEMKKNALVTYPCDQSEAISLNDTKLMSGIEKVFKKIENIRNQLVFLREQESQSYQHQIDEKMEKLNQILNRNGDKGSELIMLGSEIDQIEEFKTNIKHGLKNVQHAIEIYQELMGKDENFENIVKSYEVTLNSLQLAEHSSSFHEHFKKLEHTFAIMKNEIESKGFSYKLLFKNQWQTDDVVEFYNDQDCDEEEDLEDYTNMNIDYESEFECEYPDSDEDSA